MTITYAKSVTAGPFVGGILHGTVVSGTIRIITEAQAAERPADALALGWATGMEEAACQLEKRATLYERACKHGIGLSLRLAANDLRRMVAEAGR